MPATDTLFKTRQDFLDSGEMIQISELVSHILTVPVYVTKHVWEWYCELPRNPREGLTVEEQTREIVAAAKRAFLQSEEDRLSFIIKRDNGAGQKIIRFFAELSSERFLDPRPSLTIYLPDETFYS